MGKIEGPRFLVDSKGETKDTFFSRFLNDLQDIKNNAARESGTDEEAFWEHVQKDLRAWTLDDLYALVSIQNNDLLDTLSKTWGEKSYR